MLSEVRLPVYITILTTYYSCTPHYRCGCPCTSLCLPWLYSLLQVRLPVYITSFSIMNVDPLKHVHELKLSPKPSPQPQP